MRTNEETGRRRYEEKEVRALLGRAMEPKRSAQSPAAPVSATGSGLSLPEVEQIAAELGIESHFVQAAVAEMEPGGLSHKRFHPLGAPGAVKMERVVLGEVTEEQWEVMVREIRQALGKVGKTGQLGRSREWTTDLDQDYVSVTPEGGRTRIAARSDPFYWLFVYLPSLGLYAVILGATTELHLAPLVEWLMAGGLASSLYGLQRVLFRALMRRHDRKIGKLLDRLEAIVAAPAAAAAEETAATTPVAPERYAQSEMPETPSPSQRLLRPSE